MRRDDLIGERGGALICTCGHADVDIGVAEEEFRVDIGRDEVVCFEDLFQFRVDKVVERVDVLLDETLGF